MTGLTTHVLDTTTGKPACGVKIELYAILQNGQASDENSSTHPSSKADGTNLPVKSRLLVTTTNHDGRTDQPLIDETAITAGTYELHFFTADYFAKQGVKLDEPPFLDEIIIRFTIADSKAHYHVPLLLSPWSYSTYRGS